MKEKKIHLIPPTSSHYVCVYMQLLNVDTMHEWENKEEKKFNLKATRRRPKMPEIPQSEKVFPSFLSTTVLPFHSKQCSFLIFIHNSKKSHFGNSWLFAFSLVCSSSSHNREIYYLHLPRVIKRIFFTIHKISFPALRINILASNVDVKNSSKWQLADYLNDEKWLKFKTGWRWKEHKFL